ncbi:MAG: amino acid permease [Acidobacteria bacterium]|nr:amino acid permease [Acidobacteriota bacterium]
MKGLFATKSVRGILEEAREQPQTLRRALGPVHVTLLGVGAIIGAGIFATIGTAAAGDAHRLGAGPALMVSFLLAGAVCAIVALCYAELASRVPISGSAYTYSYATLGELVAWIIGWDLIIEYAVGNVAVAISWANYFKTFLAEAGVRVPAWLSTDWHTAQRIPGLLESAPHAFGVPIVFNLLAFSIVAAITVVLLIGIRESAWANASMVVIKLLVLAFFVAVGTRYAHAENWHPFLPNGWTGVASGAAVIFFAYIGFDAVSTLAEETRNPKRDLPVGILASLVLCTVIYIVVAAVFTGMIPFSALAGRLATEQAEPLTLALDYVHLKGMVIYVVALGSVVAHTAVLFVFQLGQPRIFFSMARDGLLPPVFARVHPRFRTPWGSTLLTGLAVGIAAMFTSLEEMVDLTNIGTLFAFTLVSVGVIVLRRREGEGEGTFRAPGGTWLPILGALGCLGLIAYLPPTSWLRFVAWLNLGIVIYAGYGSVRSRLTGRASAGNAAEHDAGTARSGAWLAVAGLVCMLAAQAADHLRSAIGGWSWPDLSSPWLVVPLLVNLAFLYPVLIHRALAARRRLPPGSGRGLATQTLALLALLLAVTLSLLIVAGLTSLGAT